MEGGVKFMRVGVPVINIRKGPGLAYPITRTLRKDTLLTVEFEYPWDDWVKVTEYGGDICGWCFREYLTKY